MKLKRPPKTVKLVVFDLDGTLVDAFHAITDSINHMMKKMGRPVQSHRKVKRSVGWGVDTLVREFVPESMAAEALRIFRQHHDGRLREKLKLLPGTKTMLPFLKKKGCILAIASNRPAKFCHIILKALGIDDHFDFVICGDAVKNPKPYPDMLKAILKASNVSASQAIFVGDMSVDVECAKRAGVFSIAIPTGSCTRQEIREAKPDLMIERLTELRSLIA